MKPILVGAATPRAGKTTAAVGLAYLLPQLFPGGQAPTLLRLAGDAGAEADARLFAALTAADGTPRTAAEAARLPRPPEATLIAEAPAGSCLEALAGLGARLLLVARPQGLPEAFALAQAAGEALVGVLVVAAPPGARAAVEGALAGALPGRPPGDVLLGLLPEDRLLASPSLQEVAQALGARVLVGAEALGQPLPPAMVAPISADAGLPYFSRRERKAVVARYDKPDLLLAAITAAARCLIITGGRPPLDYVTARAAEEGIPTLLVEGDTLSALRALEGLYEDRPLGSAEKVGRIRELFQEHLDGARLREALGP